MVENQSSLGPLSLIQKSLNVSIQGLKRSNLSMGSPTEMGLSNMSHKHLEGNVL